MNRLSGITSTPSNKAHLAFDVGYTYSDANQRVRANVGDGSYWIYEYDKLGQVTSAKRYWNDGTPVAGQQHTYGFDEIGNRTASSSGGDENGANLRSISYASNPLNQLTAATGGKYAEVLGGAANVSGAAVTVNSTAAYRKGEYFRKEVGPSSTSPLLQSVTVTATLGANSETKTGSLLLAPSNQTFGYDEDGNMTNDSVWSYKWDAENRLIETKSLPSAANAAIPSGVQLWVTYKYDAAGRRIQKSVRTWNSRGSTWNAATSECFVYDGWNVVGTFDSTTKAYKQGYVWGLDLSGSVKGAGGVGGLLQVRDTSNGAHFVAYDGVGNVVGLVDISGNVTATYEYDAFGKTLRASGAMAKLNPFRFSTKWADDETGHYYYGYRYYSPDFGRWINRDPIEEWGGLNVNGFVFNDGIDLFDPYGLHDADGVETAMSSYLYDEETRAEQNCLGQEAWERAKKMAKDAVFAVVAATPIPVDDAAMAAFLGMTLAKNAKLAKVGEKLLSAAKSGAKKVADKIRDIPNRWGRRGGPAHQAETQKVADDIRNRGLEPDFEVHVPTPGGAKENRFTSRIVVSANERA